MFDAFDKAMQYTILNNFVEEAIMLLLILYEIYCVVLTPRNQIVIILLNKIFYLFRLFYKVVCLIKMNVLDEHRKTLAFEISKLFSN